MSGGPGGGVIQGDPQRFMGSYPMGLNNPMMNSGMGQMNSQYMGPVNPRPQISDFQTLMNMYAQQPFNPAQLPYANPYPVQPTPAPVMPMQPSPAQPFQQAPPAPQQSPTLRRFLARRDAQG